MCLLMHYGVWVEGGLPRESGILPREVVHKDRKVNEMTNSNTHCLDHLLFFSFQLECYEYENSEA